MNSDVADNLNNKFKLYLKAANLTKRHVVNKDYWIQNTKIEGPTYTYKKKKCLLIFLQRANCERIFESNFLDIVAEIKRKKKP